MGKSCRISSGRGKHEASCDPWIEGFVFDNSWALLSETRFRYQDFARVTHIWFSHEHPDHFFPPNVKSIPTDIRRNITVLFQPTKDKRVIKLCRGLGFQSVIELPNAEWFPISDEVYVLCQPVPRGDSWLAIRTKDQTVLNLNDCVYESEVDLAPLVARLKDIDLLITQFSYASWWGNPEEIGKWQNAAADMLTKMQREVSVLQPKDVLLSASFVYFGHEENRFMNDYINTVQEAYDFLRSDGRANVIVLYPGDVWSVGQPRDSSNALRRYAEDYGRALRDPVKITTSSASLEELVQASGSFLRTLRRNNSLLLLQRLPSATLYLSDLDIGFRFGLRGLREIKAKPREEYDITLSSRSLLYCLRFPWGGETLFINGRFRAPVNGDRHRFFRWFSIAQSNSRWTYYNREYYVAKAIGKLKALAQHG